MIYDIIKNYNYESLITKFIHMILQAYIIFQLFIGSTFLFLLEF